MRSYHSLFCLTRRAADVTGFLTTIHSMIEVANDSEYLLDTSVCGPNTSHILSHTR